MRRDEFDYQINRLKNNYGKNHFSNEKCEILWEALKNKEASDFSHAVGFLIMSSRYIPTGNEMIAAVIGDGSLMQKEVFACRDCDGSGRISSVDTGFENRAACSWRCSCKNGDRYPNFPRWSNAPSRFKRAPN